MRAIPLDAMERVALCVIGLIWIVIEFYKMIKEIWGKK